MQGYIHSTESFGTVDGPGIRFVIFLQGCPMRCLYCHNPDTWEPGEGTKRSTDELLNEYESYRPFLKNGGLTVTGGEPLLQIDFVTELFMKAKARGIHTCLDTSGITYTPEHTEKFDALMKVTDLVMLDIKHIDPQEHKKLTGHSNERILAFARYVSEKKIPLWIRHVVVPGITDKQDYLLALGHFLATLPAVQALDVLPYHTMGRVKYESLGIPYPLEGVEALPKQKAKEARDVILKGIREGRKKTGSPA